MLLFTDKPVRKNEEQFSFSFLINLWLLFFSFFYLPKKYVKRKKRSVVTYIHTLISMFHMLPTGAPVDIGPVPLASTVAPSSMNPSSPTGIYGVAFYQCHICARAIWNENNKPYENGLFPPCELREQVTGCGVLIAIHSVTWKLPSFFMIFFFLDAYLYLLLDPARLAYFPSHLCHATRPKTLTCLYVWTWARWFLFIYARGRS